MNNRNSKSWPILLDKFQESKPGKFHRRNWTVLQQPTLPPFLRIWRENLSTDPLSWLKAQHTEGVDPKLHTWPHPVCPRNHRRTGQYQGNKPLRWQKSSSGHNYMQINWTKQPGNLEIEDALLLHETLLSQVLQDTQRILQKKQSTRPQPTNPFYRDCPHWQP